MSDGFATFLKTVQRHDREGAMSEKISSDVKFPKPPDYGAELYLRFVEDIISRLTDKEWERVRKVRDA